MSGDSGVRRGSIGGTLTASLKRRDSPVREFMQTTFGAGSADVQKEFRQTVGSLQVPPADLAEVNAGTLGTAADLLLHFLVDPSPRLASAAKGLRLLQGVGVDVAPQLEEWSASIGQEIRFGATEATEPESPLLCSSRRPE